MPTENRSSNTEMVSVPPFIGLEPLVGRYYPARCRRCGWVGSSEELTEDDAQCTRDVGDRLCLGDCDELQCDDLLRIIQAMSMPVQQHQGEPVAWSPVKPNAPGAYWVRGNGLGQDALVQVIDDQGELRCDLHQRTTETNFGYGYAVSDLSEEFEWLGPLYTHADAGEVERLRAEVKRLDLLVAQADYNYDSDRANFKRQPAERDALLARIIGKRDACAASYWFDEIQAMLSASAEPSAPMEAVPDGYCIMPKQFTAENGAKALLLGEFKLEVTHECPECLELDEPVEGCEICDGAGEYGQRHIIPWEKIKFIYSEAVKGLALKPQATPSRKS